MDPNELIHGIHHLLDTSTWDEYLTKMISLFFVSSLIELDYTIKYICLIFDVSSYGDASYFIYFVS
jgi:hypothetical protein